MVTQRIEIKKTTDYDVACALASLAGFGKGTLVSKINNIYSKKLNEKCVVVFHKEVSKKAGGDVAEAMAYHGPNIIVTQIYRSPKGDKIDWQPTDEYLIDFNSKIDPSLIGKIERRIRLENRRSNMSYEKFQRELELLIVN